VRDRFVLSRAPLAPNGLLIWCGQFLDKNTDSESRLR
jgi:hypothetical protein